MPPSSFWLKVIFEEFSAIGRGWYMASNICLFILLLEFLLIDGCNSAPSMIHIFT